MTAVRHPSHTPLWGGTRALPDDVVCCPRCTGRIYYVDTLSDTLDEQTRTWLCEDCAGTGTLTLSIKVKRAPNYEPAPKYAGMHLKSRQWVA